MRIDEVFETIIFPDLKKYLEENSEYKPKLVKVYTQESKIFPLVTMILADSTNKYNNLTYGEETENFDIEINVYATDKDNTSKRTICNKITDQIVKWLKDNYHLSITVKKDIQNIDNSVHRNNIRISGVLDTKYEEVVIYPMLYTHRTWY